MKQDLERQLILEQKIIQIQKVARDILEDVGDKWDYETRRNNGSAELQFITTVELTQRVAAARAKLDKELGELLRLVTTSYEGPKVGEGRLDMTENQVKWRIS